MWGFSMGFWTRLSTRCPKSQAERSRPSQCWGSRRVLTRCVGGWRREKLLSHGSSFGERIFPDDFDLDRGPARLGSAQLILVRGLLDHFISEEAHASQEARLEELGIPFRTITHARGHELDPALLREIAGVLD